ncbi:MAG: hypothetical protein AAGF07_01400 [Patescibacteria group bacterium]
MEVKQPKFTGIKVKFQNPESKLKAKVSLSEILKDDKVLSESFKARVTQIQSESESKAKYIPEIKQKIINNIEDISESTALPTRTFTSFLNEAFSYVVDKISTIQESQDNDYDEYDDLDSTDYQVPKHNSKLVKSKTKEVSLNKEKFESHSSVAKTNETKKEAAVDLTVKRNQQKNLAVDNNTDEIVELDQPLAKEELLEEEKEKAEREQVEEVLEQALKVESIRQVSEAFTQEVLSQLDPIKSQLNSSISEMQSGLNQALTSSQQDKLPSSNLHSLETTLTQGYNTIKSVTDKNDQITDTFRRFNIFLERELGQLASTLQKTDKSKLNSEEVVVYRKSLELLKSTKEQFSAQESKVRAELEKHLTLTTVTSSVLDRSKKQVYDLSSKLKNIQETKSTQQKQIENTYKQSIKNITGENKNIQVLSQNIQEISKLLKLVSNQEELDNIAQAVADSKDLADITRKGILEELNNWQQEFSKANQILEEQNKENTLVIAELKNQKVIISKQIDTLKFSLKELDSTVNKLKSEVNTKTKNLRLNKHLIQNLQLPTTATSQKNNISSQQFIQPPKSVISDSTNKPSVKTTEHNDKQTSVFNIFTHQNPLTLFGVIGALMITTSSIKNFKTNKASIDKASNQIEKQVLQINQAEKQLATLQNELNVLKKLNQNFESSKNNTEYLEFSTKIIDFLSNIGLTFGVTGIGAILLFQTRTGANRLKLSQELAKYIEELQETNSELNESNLTHKILENLKNSLKNHNSPLTKDLLNFLESSSSLSTPDQIAKLDQLIRGTFDKIQQKPSYDVEKATGILSALALSMVTLSTFNVAFGEYLNNKLDLTNQQIQFTQKNIETTQNKINEKINDLKEQKQDLENKIKELDIKGANFSDLLKLKKRAELEILRKKLESELVAFKAQLESKKVVGISPLLDQIQESKSGLSPEPNAKYLAILSSLILGTRSLGKILESKNKSELQKTTAAAGGMGFSGKNNPDSKTQNKKKPNRLKSLLDTGSGSGGGKKPPKPPSRSPMPEGQEPDPDKRKEDERKRLLIQREQLERQRKLDYIRQSVGKVDLINDANNFKDLAFECSINPDYWLQIKVLIDYHVRFMEKGYANMPESVIGRFRLLKGIQIFIDTNFNEIFFEQRHSYSHFIFLNAISIILLERKQFIEEIYSQNLTIDDVKPELKETFRPVYESIEKTMQDHHKESCNDLSSLASLVLIQSMRCISANKGTVHTTNYGLTNNLDVHEKGKEIFAAVGLDPSGQDLIVTFENMALDDRSAIKQLNFLLGGIPVESMTNEKIEMMVSNISGNYFASLKFFLDNTLPEMLTADSVLKDKPSIFENYNKDYQAWLNSDKVQNYYLLQCEELMLDTIFNNKKIEVAKAIEYIDSKITNPNNLETLIKLKKESATDVYTLSYLNTESLQQLKNSILLEQLEIEEAKIEAQKPIIENKNEKVQEIPKEIPKKKLEDLPLKEHSLIDSHFSEDLYETAGARIDDGVLNLKSTSKHINRVSNLLKLANEVYSSRQNQSDEGLTETIILLAKNPAALGQSPVITPGMVEYFKEGNEKSGIPEGSIEFRVGRAYRLFLKVINGKLRIIFFGNPAYHGGHTT